MATARKLELREVKVARSKRAKLSKKETARRMRDFAKRKKAFVASVRASTAQLEAEAMKLDLSARAALAERLLASLDDLSEAECEELWAEEAERRAEELRSGKVRALNGDEVMRRARQAIS